ncbi:MAG TPA: glucosyltransferase domain-containing protein [Vicinamibacterales bacterium]|nr:glucosyltransferase domain-containing protein [Vicinamibacterales bacterium]
MRAVTTSERIRVNDAAAGTRGVRFRRFVWLVALVPPLLYSPAILREYGLRDDYSMLREAIVQPAKLIAVCVAEGRPIYGLLLSITHPHLDVPSLAVARLLAALLIGFAGAMFARILATRFQWSTASAVAAGILLALLPATQVVASWASCWPQAAAGAMSIGAFAISDAGFDRRGPPRLLAILAAFALLLAATLTYQSNALLYVVPVGAGWLGRRARTWRWLAGHLGLVAAALALSFVITLVLFDVFGFRPSRRVVIDIHPFAKFVWFAQNALREALGLYVLRDMMRRTEPWYTAMQALVATGVVTSLFIGGGIRQAMKRTAGLGALLLVAYAVSFVAAERWPTYRTVWPLSGVVLIAFGLGVRRCLELGGAHQGRLRPVLAASIVALIAASALWNVDRLVARPQAEEWSRMMDEASGFDPQAGGRVFVVLQRPNTIVAPIRHLDEFGSLSADADWVAKEMFIQALRTAHPDVADPATRLAWQSGYSAPPRGLVATIIDLRVPSDVH